MTLPAQRGWGCGEGGIAELGEGEVSWVGRGGSIGEEVGTQDRGVGGGGGVVLPSCGCDSLRGA